MWEKIKYVCAKVLVKFFGNWQLYPSPMFLSMGNTHYRIRGDEMRHILGLVKKGDILLRRYNHYLSGWVIPGYYNHVGLLISSTKVIHALEHGVVEEDILTFLRTDEVAVVRPKVDKDGIAKACSRAVDELGKQYDFLFDAGNDERFYCSELVKCCFPDVFEVEDRVIKPQMFVEHQDGDVIYESRTWRQHKE